MHKPTERVLNVLTLLAEHLEGLTLTDIAQKLSIPKSTISPILQEMTTQKFLYLNQVTSKYTIGISAYYVAESFNAQNTIFPELKKKMAHICNTLNEICQVGILTGSDITYILKEEPATSSPIKIISHVGKKIPAHCTALGKALLSNLSLKELHALLPQSLTKFTANTITDFNILYEQLLEIKKTHIAFESEEITEHLCCYAVPIVLPDKSQIALSISLPLFRTDEKKIEAAKKLLLQAKKELELYNI